MKKLISLFLCILMIVSVSAPAFADGETTEKGYTVYTEEEYKALNLETKLVNYWKPGVLDEQVAVADRLDTTPAKYLFKTNDTADSKEYIILKNVNAGANDGYFVMVNNYVDSCKQTQYNSGYNANSTEISRYFDIKDPNCAAYKMNLDTYISANFPLMKDYINTHRWYTEDTSYSSKYSTDAKISLLSLTEYVVNADRIGMQNGLQQWLTRTPNGSKLLWQFIVSTKGADGSATVYSTWEQRANRPCFYLSKDFFRNVKLDMSLLKTQDSETAKIIKEIASEENGIATLTKAGYTESDLTELGIATGSVKITSATIAGDGKCGNTITATVKTDGNADKTEYEWYGVKTDGTSTLLATTETNTYTVKFADLDYAKINCLAEVYSGETLSHSAYTNEITLETKPTFPTYTSLTKAEDVEDTVEAYKFTVEGRELVMLKSVNATANDGIFVATSVPVASETVKYYDVTPAEFNKLTKLIYDADDPKSMAYVVNQTDFWDREYAVNRTDTATKAKIIPNSLRNYINEHRWWNEGVQNKAYTQDPWATNAKVAVMSWSEYDINRDRYGYGNIGSYTYNLRSFRNVANDSETSTSAAKPTNPNIAIVQNSTYRMGQSGVSSSTINETNGTNTYGRWFAKPICFYLNPDFFANVKVDFTLANTEVVAILRKKLADKTVDELRTIGYSLTEIKELFPDKVANLGKIAMIDFSKDGNNVKFTCVNLSDGSITFKPVAAVYASDAMVCSNIGEEITLAKGESKPVNVTLDVGTSTPDTLKAFAWNVATLTPFAPCKTVNYSALAPET